VLIAILYPVAERPVRPEHASGLALSAWIFTTTNALLLPRGGGQSRKLLCCADMVKLRCGSRILINCIVGA